MTFIESFIREVREITQILYQQKFVIEIVKPELDEIS